MTAAGESVVLSVGTSRPGQSAGGGSTTPHAGQVTVSAGLEQGCQFLVDFGAAGTPSMQLWEPEPLGEGQGPDASRVIRAAAATTSPPGLTAAALGPHYAPLKLGPPLIRLRLM